VSADIARWDLRLRRRSTLAYSVGLAGYAVLIVVLYPTFEHDASLDQLTSGNATLSALLGATGSLTSPAGWMNANLYANFAPLFALFMTIGYGAAAIAGQDEDGTLGGIAGLPVTRTTLLAEKVAALVVLSLPVPLVTLVAALVGRGFDVTLDTSALVGTTLGLALLGLDFGLVAVAVGTWTGHRSTAVGIAVSLAAVAYVVSALAPVVDWVHSIRFVSPFYWSVGADQLETGLDLGSALALLLVAVAMAVIAFGGFRRMDIH
jgi:ABC-2 type transport system permease protein